METKEYTTIDKSKWDRGEWDSEPDKVQWQDEETGMPCLAVRHPSSGHWCGYVAVNADHPLFNQHYDVPCVGVHGGLTFAEQCQIVDDESHGICHTPSTGEPDHVWWFGFDCAHLGDLSPAYDMGGSYKSLNYIKRECKSLASQLKQVA